MAIAALDFDLLDELPELPWPRPVLHVVPTGDGWEDEDTESEIDDDEPVDLPEPAANRLIAWADRVGWNDEPAVWNGAPAVWNGVPSLSDEWLFDEPVALPAARGAAEVDRRPQRAAVLRRRQLVALGVVVVAALALLALPLRALGASPASPASAPAAASGNVYVVQPGDTEWSIAQRFDAGGDPRPLATAIARQTGSAVVVPGERISIP